VKVKVMSESGKFLTGLLLGAAAGAAIGYFLQTDKGKETLSGLKDMAGKAGDQFKDAMSQVEKEVGDLVEKGKGFAEDLEQKAKQATVG
jgi:gas vesicle protein